MFVGNDRIVSRQMEEPRNKALKLQQARLKAITSELVNPVLENNRIHLGLRGSTGLGKGTIIEQFVLKRAFRMSYIIFHFLGRDFDVYLDIGPSFVADHAKETVRKMIPITHRSKANRAKIFPGIISLRPTKSNCPRWEL